MKITIDTQHDNHEDIKKVLHILSHVIEKKDSTFVSSNYQSNEPGTNNEAGSAGFMNMFGDSSNEKKKEISDTAPDFTNFLNLANKEEEEDKKEDKPKLQYF